MLKLLVLLQIAVCVAHRLLRSQTGPSEESTFLEKWQSDTPGVGPLYQVSMNMLAGVALPTGTNKEWKYFPQDKLPVDPAERFDTLFQEREKWTERDITPYLTRIVQDTSMADLLVRHCRTVTDDVDGVQHIFYVKR